MYKLVITSDGSHTLYVPGLNEHFHSIHGAIRESEHIFITNGLKSFPGPPDILETGLGTGLNALLTLLALRRTEITISYTSIEKHPLPAGITDKFNYGKLLGGEAVKFLRDIHAAPWNEFVQITEYFRLRKIEGDLTTMDLGGNYNLIYYDAFGPDKQPEMWTGNVFSKIAAVTRDGGVFVTYSAKGEVKRNLRANGFDVKLLPGPPGKRQMIRAVKKGNLSLA